ncbi:1884_t:CDS:2 [Paraglomus brasilianum]|uniref:1884_t:CDS:1 n=1 Tax=Paraglomus brasilianum TaxID=144538 RepID=A0A9N9ACL8_9GLOM|nr:1884_t:CDS:2 [Paraglomus brasilianum]
MTKFTVPLVCDTYCIQRAYPLNDGYVFVTLTSANKTANGTLVDWSGRILQSDMLLTDVPVDGKSPPLAKTNANVNENFLVATRDGNTVLWKIFSAPNNTGQITQLYGGSITGNDDNLLVDHEIVPTTEGGYGIAILKRIPTSTQDPLSSPPQWFFTAAGSVVKEVIGIRQLPYGGFMTVEVNTGSPYEASLAELIPIDPSRITTNKRSQPDPNAPARQILFSVTLKSSDDMSQRTVHQIIDDLDELIKNKGYTSFSQEYPTSYLDETFGFLPVANLWDACKFKFIGVLIGLLILAILYFCVRQKYPEGQSFFIVKLALIIADLSLYLAFVLSSAKKVSQTHTPRRLTVSHDIIPFLSFVMSSAALTSSIVGHIYDGYIKLKEKRQGHSIPEDEKHITDTDDLQEAE